MARGVSKASRTVNNLIKERMKLLEDFGICNSTNEENIRLEMKNRIDSNPEVDPDLILERITSKMINTFGWKN